MCAQNKQSRFNFNGFSLEIPNRKCGCKYVFFNHLFGSCWSGLRRTNSYPERPCSGCFCSQTKISSLVSSCARAKSKLSRSGSLDERLFLVLVVPRSRSFQSLKLLFLIPVHSGSLVIEIVLVPRMISINSVLEQVSAMNGILIGQNGLEWTTREQNEQLILSERRTDHVSNPLINFNG